MAEHLALILARPIMNRLSSIASQELFCAYGVDHEVLKLRPKLEAIEAVLQDAENRQVNEVSVKRWLTRLADVAYDTDDVLDEVSYEALRLQVESENKVLNSISTFIFRCKLVRKIKIINEKLDGIYIDKSTFQFHMGVEETTIMECRETHSHLGNGLVVGRENDIAMILDKLLKTSYTESTDIICIVGIGGMGKTTLAKLVYNQEVVVNCFELRMWVCVYQTLNEQQVYSKIVDSLASKSVHRDSSLDIMIAGLKEHLGGKKFLLVLDDMWETVSINWGEVLSTLLASGLVGSKIIVTTRSNEVAKIVQPLDNHHLKLKGLSEDQCWETIEKFIVKLHKGLSNRHYWTLKMVEEEGKAIMRKSGGVPLAVKTLGGLMLTKFNRDDWLSILHNYIGNLPDGQTKMMRILKLSYDHLPADVKQCFSYCSIFPRHYLIEKKKLIQQWMAEGLLKTYDEPTRMESVGDEYFNKLLSNNLFEDVERDEHHGVVACKMQSLIHDLARSTAGPECSVVYASGAGGSGAGGSEGGPISEIRRLRTVFDDVKEGTSIIPVSLSTVEKLRTFFAIISRGKNIKSFTNDVFLKFKSLRVLDLSNFSDIEVLLPLLSFHELKHLRFLDLSSSNMKVLPKSITTLYNLQTLRLRHCYFLQELPEDMMKLVRLRHLEIDNLGRWTEMPREIGQLSCLQTLPIFKVGEHSKGLSYGIQQLGGLDFLERKLEIHNLENVRDGSEAQGAQLQRKRELQWLELYWKSDNSNNNISDEENNDYEVLEGLKPNGRKLEILGIHSYQGVEFPGWISSQALGVRGLQKITLEGCDRCEQFPKFGSLIHLRVLKVKGMKSMEIIGFSRTEGEFCSLQELSLQGMPNLATWSKDSQFSVLEELTIEDCPKLTMTPTQFPKLSKLKIKGTTEMVVQSVTGNSTQLTSLYVSEIPNLMFLPQELLQRNGYLQFLEIRDCPNLLAFHPHKEEETAPTMFCNNLVSMEIQNCTSLQRLLPTFSTKRPELFRRLVIKDCPLLQEFPEVRELVCLDTLNIIGCHSLASVPDVYGLTCLRRLAISDCESLRFLPKGIQSLTTLEDLDIGGFQKDLTSFPFPDEEVNAFQHLISLRCLQIRGWPSLNHLPEQIQHLATLQVLNIWKYDNLLGLPTWLGSLSSLEYLGISWCMTLEHLPPKEHMQSLAGLQRVEIRECPLLKDKCAKEAGEEWHKISHIPQIQMDDDLVQGII